MSAALDLGVRVEIGADREVLAQVAILDGSAVKVVILILKRL
jgi:hypothetical protein